MKDTRKKRPYAVPGTKVAAPVSTRKKQRTAPDLVFGIIILAYALITVITPNLYTFDSNGPKFLALAMLNLVTFGLLMSRNDIRNNREVWYLFFRNRIGLVYLLMMILALLSFVKSVNIFESVLHYSKMLTIFSAAYFISIILRRDTRYLTLVSAVLSLLLIIDSLTLFYHIASSLMEGRGPAIFQIKSVYSNKNILAAALFVKIPFALWLFTFEKGKLHWLGMVTLFLAFIAILFMSTRAFYVGSIVILAFYLVFTAIRYHRRNSLRRFYTVTISIILAIGLGLGVYTLTLKTLYPKDYHDLYTVGFLERLKTVAGGEKLRHDSWSRSMKLIAEDPLLGVGCGNWKVAVLKYENPEKPDYVYQYKTHNDFLEIACETGVPGAILFILIFVFAAVNFLRVFFTRDNPEESYRLLFLPAFGLLAYAFDAFFNFPADRPEIGSLFAMFTGAAIAVSPAMKVFSRVETQGSATKPAGEDIFSRLLPALGRFTSLYAILFILLMVSSIAVLVVNFRSLKLQRMAKEDLMRPALEEPTAKFIDGYPLFPNLSMEAEPIVVSKSRYLFRDKKYQEALDLLKADRSSPWDTRPEFFIAQAYFNLGDYDSSLRYNYKVYVLKPLFFNNILNICRVLEMQNRYDEAIGLVETYTRMAPQKEDGYLFGAALCQNGGRIDKAIALLDSGHKKLPENAEILKQKQTLDVQKKIKPHEAIYNVAQQAYMNKDYTTALRYLNEFIGKEPGLANAYEMRAFCHFFLKNYRQSLEDVEKAFAGGLETGGMFNLRGVNLRMLGNDSAACRNFERAVTLGDKDAIQNYERFCKK